MANQSLLDQANEKLRNVQAQLNKINYVFDYHFQLQQFNQQTANAMRVALAKYRAILQAEKQTKALYESQKAIHEALLFLAEHAPLNQKTIGGEWLCPITLKVFDLSKGVALSNGCYYPWETVGYYAAGQKLFPKKLPGSDIEIDQRDFRLAQRKAKIDSVVNGMYVGVIASYLPLFAVMGVALIAKVSLMSLLEGALIGLGLAAGLATGMTVGVFVAPLILFTVAGAALGAWYYFKHHPSELAPNVENEKLVTSTPSLLTKLDVKQDPISTLRFSPKSDLIVEEDEPSAQPNSVSNENEEKVSLLTKAGNF